MPVSRQVQVAGLLVLREPQALRVRRVQLVLQQQQGRWEPRVPLAQLARPELPVRLVPVDLQAALARRVLSARQVRKARKARRGQLV